MADYAQEYQRYEFGGGRFRLENWQGEIFKMNANVLQENYNQKTTIKKVLEQVNFCDFSGVCIPRIFPLFLPIPTFKAQKPMK